MARKRKTVTAFSFWALGPEREGNSVVRVPLLLFLNFLLLSGKKREAGNPTRLQRQ